MCYGWYEEALFAERIRLARERAEELKRSTGPSVPESKLRPERKPEKENEPRPEPVPA